MSTYSVHSNWLRHTRKLRCGQCLQTRKLSHWSGSGDTRRQNDVMWNRWDATGNEPWIAKWTCIWKRALLNILGDSKYNSSGQGMASPHNPHQPGGCSTHNTQLRSIQCVWGGRGMASRPRLLLCPRIRQLINVMLIWAVTKYAFKRSRRLRLENGLSPLTAPSVSDYLILYGTNCGIMFKKQREGLPWQCSG